VSVAIRATAQALFIVLVLGGILFGIAQRLDWLNAWLLIDIYAIFLLLALIWAPPALIEERSRVAPNTKAWDKIILILNGVLLLALLGVAALDAGRVRHEMPFVATAIGIVAAICSGAVILSTVTSNPYLSRVARIQDDRGQTVITTGPYRFVRHPMYSALILLMFAIALILGSSLALIPAFLIGVLYVIRAALEDRMLRNELAGYSKYAARVRYRLIPGIW
jgi:protein-S-isoprenylcysteine O-methyltransferase Ste14